MLAVLALTLAKPAWAQQPAPSLVINQLDASAYPTVRAVVTVLDANHVPVPGLNAQQFHASDGSSPLSVSAVQTVQDSNLKLSVVLAIDTSGSMRGEPLDRAKQAADAFVSALGPNDDVALVAFSDAVRPVTGFTSDRAALQAGIASLQAGGSTVLYEAVSATVFAAHQSPAPREAIVLLTDGQNDAPTSQATADGSLSVATGSGVPFFTIGFGDQPDVAYLQALSGGTHGEYSSATTADVGDVYRHIAQLLRGQYVVTMTAQRAADGKPASLHLAADVGGTQAAGDAQFTRGSAPPAVSPTLAPTAAPVRAAPKASGGRSGVLAALIVVAVAVGVIGPAGFVMYRRVRRARAQRQRELGAGRHSDETMPEGPSPLAAGVAEVPASGRGRLVELSSDGRGRVFELGAGPVTIGSSPGKATIVLAGDNGVAPEHARIWLREGRYLLHHAAGSRRKTVVGGREADWVTLEPGDEIQVGGHRFVFEEG